MRWDYYAITAWFGEVELATGEKGAFGGPKKEKRKGWWVSFDSEHHPEADFLRRMGDDGWELVGVVVSHAYSAGGSIDKWYEPAHRLFLKKPKE